MKTAMKNKPRTKRVILFSLAADASLALTKFVTAVISGSAAMFAEALHSLADMSSQILLLIGRKLASQAPDVAHPFGYGMERFFWPFLVSVVIFSVGGVFSIWRGWGQILSPHPLEHVGWNYLVLGFAFLFEGGSARFAWKELKKLDPRKPIWRLIRDCKKPALITIFLQDTASIVGVTVAALGIGLAQITTLWLVDGVTSVVLGGLLFGISWIIAKETKSLLLGESASAENIRKIREAVKSTPEVERMIRLLTMHLGPDEILVNLDLAFKDGLNTDKIEACIDQIEDKIRQAIPEATKIFIEAES
jgi:cation diffusion facilitator family transporter